MELGLHEAWIDPTFVKKINEGFTRLDAVKKPG
jgi:hypothetical protein